VAIASTMANLGLAMAPLPLLLIGGTLASAVGFAFLVDLAKAPVFKHLEIT
jgi:hypothetical protein